jgi:hypothetical protein
MFVAALGVIGAALLAPMAGAVTAPGQSPLGVQHIVPVAEGCGYGYHWVGRYRRSDGAWIPGHCQRNP